MIIVDSVMLNDQIDLLKVRISEHYPYVDKFYVVEATKTHSGLDKPLCFEDRKDEFSEWSDKIEHMVIDGDEHFRTGGVKADNSYNEKVQRWALYRFKPEVWKESDYIINMDGDEIIHDWDTVMEVLSQTPPPYATNVCMDNFNYFIDSKWDKPIFADRRIQHGRTFKWLSIKQPSYHKFKKPMAWHFSSLGGVEAVSRKLKSIRSAPRVVGVTGEKHVRECLTDLRSFFVSKRTATPGWYMKEQTDLSYLPQYMKDHMDVFEKYKYRSFLNEG